MDGSIDALILTLHHHDSYTYPLRIYVCFYLTITVRRHQNYLEILPPALFLLLSSGVFFPKISAGLGVVFIAGRELYARGYRSEKGAPARYNGGFWVLSVLGLLVGTVAGSLGHMGVVPKLPSI